jgi:hypothetical protein
LQQSLAPEDALPSEHRATRKFSLDLEQRDKQKIQEMKNLLKSKLNMWLS